MAKIFEEIPDDITEDWTHGVIIGGMAEISKFRIAQAYKYAGDILVDQIIGNDEPVTDLIYPILFNYRHSIELYIKAFVPEFGHNIEKLLNKLNPIIKGKFNQELPKRFMEIMLEIDEFDKKGTSFRYIDKNDKTHKTQLEGEFWIDVANLHRHMSQLEYAFTQIEENFN